jgi:hypothetical protein
MLGRRSAVYMVRPKHAQSSHHSSVYVDMNRRAVMAFIGMEMGLRRGRQVRWQSSPLTSPQSLRGSGMRRPRGQRGPVTILVQGLAGPVDEVRWDGLESTARWDGMDGLMMGWEED